MSNYTKNNNFTGFDGTGKVISGVEFDSEFDEIATAIATKAEKNGASGEDFTVNDLTINGDVLGGKNATLKAWVTFDGGNPPTIYESMNVDSVSYSYAGNYVVTLTDTAPSANYFVALTGDRDQQQVVSRTTTTANLRFELSDGTDFDPGYASVGFIY